MTFDEFRYFCTLLSPTDFSHLGEEFLRAKSAGFQTKSVSPAAASLYFTVASSLSGGAANAFSRTVVAPLERTRLQMSVDPTKYRNMFHCISSIYAEEGTSRGAEC